MANSNNKAKFSLFDSHHKMERFAAVFMAFVVALISIAGICYKKHIDSQKINLTEIAKYTTGGVFSLSSEPVDVCEVYRNENFTKAFILLKFSDMNKFNADANNYELYMTNGSGDAITGSPTASVYVFGNTGYVGLYFANSSGFKSQLYDITVRHVAKDPASYAGYKVAYEGMIDQSDMYNNQLHIRANFGGTAGVKAKFLESDNMSIIDIYNETVASADYNNVKTSLNETLVAMNVEIGNLNNYTKQLSDYGMRVPALPIYIAGDYVTNDVTKTSENPMSFDSSMLNAGNNVIVDNYNVVLDVSSKDEVEKLVASETMYYVTDFVYPGGVQYNYQGVTLSDHILHDVIGEGTYSDYVKDKSLESSNNAMLVKFDVGAYYKTWYYNNGSVFDSTNMDVASKSIYDTIQKYQSSVSNLIDLKQQCQKTYLMELLKIESSTESVANVTSLNSSALKKVY